MEKDLMEPTPPPPPISQPPPRNWWQRNWKWFVPTGCLIIFAFFAAFIALIVFAVFGAMKSTDVYKTAVARAKADERVIAALGPPIREGMFFSGTTNATGGSGEADLAIPISGPKGKGTLYAVATKSAGAWEYSKLMVEIQGTGEKIDINEEETPESDEEVSSEDETDSSASIAAVTLGGREEPKALGKGADHEFAEALG